MASPKIEALKAELTVSLSRSIVDRDELIAKIEETVITEVLLDLQRKTNSAFNAYSYARSERANTLEILVDACDTFIRFASEIRAGKVLKLSAPVEDPNGEV